jgi:hypothetical protein
MVLLQWVLLSCCVLCCAYNKYKANYLCFVWYYCSQKISSTLFCHFTKIRCSLTFIVIMNYD